MMRTEAAAIAPPCRAVHTARAATSTTAIPSSGRTLPIESPEKTREIAMASVTPVAMRATLIPRPSSTAPTIARHSVRASLSRRRSKARALRGRASVVPSLIAIPRSCNTLPSQPDSLAASARGPRVRRD